MHPCFWTGLKRIGWAGVLGGCCGLAHATSNLNPDQADAWSANLGWLNGRADAVNGVEVCEFFCAGSIYSANVGWMSLGNGMPLNGTDYSNVSPSDFGVNVDAAGNLRGYAYGANIGWINFEQTGAARIDLTTGQLSGYAYGANVGWISLGDATFKIQASSLDAGPDSNGNGIPDAWEMYYAGNLTTFTATSDSDRDGQTDLQEYLAGTNPLDPNDFLHIVDLSISPDKAVVSITWTSKPTRQYRIQARQDLAADYLWQDSGLGTISPDGTLTTRTFPAGTQNFLRIEAMRPLSP